MRPFVVPVVLLLAALLPASAQAAAPTVTTGPVADITQSTATLTGTVDPNNNATVVYFKFGPTNQYGSQTADADAGAGNTKKSLTAPIVGLTPYTRIHYRLFARFGNKTVAGKDRVFRTKKQPLGLTLASNPSQVAAGGNTTLLGTLAGTDNAGQQVVLQSNPWPYTQGFVNLGNPQVVDSTGAFSFPVLGVQTNTQYRVQVPAKPNVVSPIVSVGVRQAVTTKVKRGKHHHFTFSGTLTPASVDTVTVQRHKHSGWKNVESDVSVVKNGVARYSVRVKLRRKGTFRVVVIDTSGSFVPNVGRTVKVRPKH
jgi:hypothetical protein